MKPYQKFVRLIALAIVASLAGIGPAAQPAYASSVVTKGASKDDIKKMAAKIVRKAGKDVKLGWNCRGTAKGEPFVGRASYWLSKSGKKMIYKVCIRSGLSKARTKWLAYHETAHIKTYKIRRAAKLTDAQFEKLLRSKFKYKPLLSANGRKHKGDAGEVIADCTAFNHTRSLEYASYVKKCPKKVRKIARTIWKLKLP